MFVSVGAGDKRPTLFQTRTDIDRIPVSAKNESMSTKKNEGKRAMQLLVRGTLLTRILQRVTIEV